MYKIINGTGEECNFRRFEPYVEYAAGSEAKEPNLNVPIYAMQKDAKTAQKALSESEDLLLRNLARLEHMRWNASQEAMGYISTATYISNYGDNFTDVPYETRHTCNERRRCHNCLINWQELDQEGQNTWNEIIEHDGWKWSPDYKLSDYGVVATTLYHCKEQIQQLINE